MLVLDSALHAFLAMPTALSNYYYYYYYYYKNLTQIPQ